MGKHISRVMMIIILVLAGGSQAEVIDVNDSATGGNSGSSWTDAYVSLQDGLAAAVGGDELWVAAGTYTPGANRTDSFVLVNDVAVYLGKGNGQFEAPAFYRADEGPVNNTVLTSFILIILFSYCQ